LRSTSVIDVAELLHLPAREGPPQLLFIHLHGAGAQPLAMVPIAERFSAAFPRAIHLLPEGFEPYDFGEGRQWFSRRDIDEDNRRARVAAVLPRISALVSAAQHHYGIASASTALIGFSQGGIIALEAAQLEPPLAGRVAAIAARYATLPERSPAATVLHLAHGKDDTVVPARYAVEAATRLVSLGGDVPADIVPGIGHEPHPELIDRLIEHMQSYLPRRVWAEALASAPVRATRVSSKELTSPIPDSKTRH
jgi:phospholipase/carboxylesterase